MGCQQQIIHNYVEKYIPWAIILLSAFLYEKIKQIYPKLETLKLSLRNGEYFPHCGLTFRRL